MPERTPNGSPIYRHAPRAAGWVPPAQTIGMEEVVGHMTRHFSTPASVYHEIVSDLVHIDVHVIPPGNGRDYWTLFTTGMSDLPMAVPAGMDEFRFAELVLFLPEWWKFEGLSMVPPPQDLERWYWPLRWLKRLARLPHEHVSWLGLGHTVPNGDPPKPFFSDTQLCCWLLLPPVGMGEVVGEVAMKDGRTVHLYVLYGITQDELNLKLEQGTEALLDPFDRAGMSAVLDPSRKSSIRKKWFGIF